MLLKVLLHGIVRTVLYGAHNFVKKPLRIVHHHHQCTIFLSLTIGSTFSHQNLKVHLKVLQVLLGKKKEPCPCPFVEKIQREDKKLKIC